MTEVTNYDVIFTIWVLSFILVHPLLNWVYDLEDFIMEQPIEGCEEGCMSAVVPHPYSAIIMSAYLAIGLTLWIVVRK